MKVRNLMILIFMVISMGLYPAKRCRTNKNVSRGKSKLIKRKKRKHNSNKFIRDLQIIEKGLSRDIYKALDHLINGKKHKKIKWFTLSE